MPSRGTRIYYCGMVNTDKLSARMGSPLLVGAAAIKMMSIVRALRAAGGRGWLVSMPVLGRQSQCRFRAATLLREPRLPTLFLPVHANPVVRKLLAAASFAWFCSTKVTRADRVVVYNHGIEYLLGLLLLKLRGCQAYQDVEDAPRADEFGLSGFLNRQIFRITFALCQLPKITASTHLAALLGIRHYCAVYGARGTPKELGVRPQAWNDLLQGGPLRVHFGGSLTRDTGLDLFCDTVRLLAHALSDEGNTSVHFHVTGLGGDRELEALQRDCVSTRVRLNWRRNLTRDEFLGEFLRCQVALSLKLPDSSMSQTTFPSKVVEIAGNGLLLITTRASDVPLIFDSSSAIIVEATAADLSRSILDIVARPLEMRAIARHGQAVAAKVFDELSVGTRLMSFLQVPNEP